MNKQEGYIKYSCDWIKKSITISDDQFKELNYWRSKLFEKKLIGVLPDGIGFGNISIKKNDNKFIISGSATGAFLILEKDHFAHVVKYSISQNSLTCEGRTKASSESLSHAVIYETLPNVKAAIHIHDKKMWESNLDKIPTTNKTAEYGTPEMALSIKELLSKNDNKESGIVIMGGHRDGIIAFGETLSEAYKIIEAYYKKIIHE